MGFDEITLLTCVGVDEIRIEGGKSFVSSPDGYAFILLQKRSRVVVIMLEYRPSYGSLRIAKGPPRRIESSADLDTMRFALSLSLSLSLSLDSPTS
jgi:hypothetical protein